MPLEMGYAILPGKNASSKPGKVEYSLKNSPLVKNYYQSLTRKKQSIKQSYEQWEETNLFNSCFRKKMFTPEPSIKFHWPQEAFAWASWQKETAILTSWYKLQVSSVIATEFIDLELIEQYSETDIVKQCSTYK